MALEGFSRRIQRRQRDQSLFVAARTAGYSSLAARVLAGRACASDLGATPVGQWVAPGLSSLDDPSGLADIERAAARVAQAVDGREQIAICTDHDVDGVTSHAILYRCLRDIVGVARERLSSFVGLRLEEGYGLSEPLAERILASGPDLVITADHGSGDEARIARLAAAGIDVIVTDHHALPESGPPASAHSCVSPARQDNTYPDPTIAGCMVAWFLAVRVVDAVVPDERAAVSELLDYCAVGTVADCVSLASINNRAVVRAGLERLNRARRPCWAAMFDRGVIQGHAVAADLAFGVGPRLNARGRLDDAMGGVAFLLADDSATAHAWAATLDQCNDERKAIERQMNSIACARADEQVAAGRATMVVYLPEGHSGVHGITASRVVERTGRPTVCLSPDPVRPGYLTGSARGIEGVHIQRALAQVAHRDSDVLVSYGGHAGAGGLRIGEATVERFSEVLEQAVREQLGEAADRLEPWLATDGHLDAGDFRVERVRELEGLGPFGEGFSPPLFDGLFRVRELKRIGTDGRHIRMRLVTEGNVAVTGLWFGAVDDGGEATPVAVGDELHLVYVPFVNEYQGRRSVQLNVRELARRPVGDAEASGATSLVSP